MGVNVYDRKDGSELSFDRNWWFWRPLWAYVQNVAGEMVADIDGDCNSGDGFETAEESKALAKVLEESITSGEVIRWAKAREAELANEIWEDCDICNGTGIRTDYVGIQQGMPWKPLNEEQAKSLDRPAGWCNACQGKGEKMPVALWYHFDPECVKELAQFLNACEGFRIC